MQKRATTLAGGSALEALAGASPHPLDREAQRIHVTWLVQLRWGEVLGQLITVLIVDLGMGIELPLSALLVLLAIAALSNAWFAAWARRRFVVRASQLAIPMALDILLLTALLFLTGGPFNPCSFLYLVHIALAAVVLPAQLTWSLVGLSLCGFAALFVQRAWLPLPMQSQLSHSDQMRLHMQGMWFAFAIAAVFITYFVSRLRQSLAQREDELSRARTLASQSEKLASLATLATGAAHELSTPLSTIAVVAKELERNLAAGPQTRPVEDARLIRREVERCREILQRMAADAGQPSDDDTAHVSVRELLATAVDGLPRGHQVRVNVAADAAESVLRSPPQATRQALRGVLKNALQASALDALVVVDARVEQGQCRIAVRDSGAGMSEDVLERAGEPFFTTKAPGDGMGLGLFLTRAVVERAGGRVQLQSSAGVGTTAVLTLPLATSATNHRSRTVVDSS
jgi:two-component system sensor histidine kinase RegB